MCADNLLANLTIFLLPGVVEMEHVGPHVERPDGSHVIYAKALFIFALSVAVEAADSFLGIRFNHFWFYAFLK